MSVLNTFQFILGHPLNRNQKLNAVIRFLKWQIGSSLVSGEVVYTWINNTKFFVRKGEAGLTGNIYAGLHEFSEMGFLLHFLRSEDLFIDVGANAGSYSILACAAVGARGIALEPIPGAYRRLVENMRLNRLEEKVHCIDKAAGRGRGRLTFTNDADTANHVLVAGEDNDEIVEVEVVSLDDVLQRESPTLLKIDVEGFESSVLDGARETLKKQSLKAVILELNGSGARYGHDESQILEVMSDNNLERYAYNPLNRKLSRFKGTCLNSENSLFIRDLSYVQERLKCAPQVSIHGHRF